MIIALLIALLFAPVNNDNCYLIDVGNETSSLYVWVSATTENGLCNG